MSALELSAPSPERLYFLDETCAFLRMSRRTAERLRRHGAFPIPELPAIDKRPRFSGAAILAFIHGQTERHALTLRRGARRA